MSNLSTEKFILKGGCYCSAVRYEITIPPYQNRPVTFTDAQNKGIEERFPSINFDHCNDCRKAPGTLVPSWIICPQSWVKWSIPVSKAQFPIPTGCSEGADIKGGELLEITSDKFAQRPSTLDGFVTAYNSSPDTWRTFCTRCGTHLSYVCLTDSGEDRVPQIDVNLGSLDRESLERPGVKPNAHIYCDYGIDWVQKVLWEGDVTLGGKPLPKHPKWNRLEEL